MYKFVKSYFVNLSKIFSIQDGFIPIASSSSLFVGSLEPIWNVSISFSSPKTLPNGLEATFNAGMVLDPNNVDIQLSLGDLFMTQNDLDKAIKTYCDAISVDPLNFMSYAKTGLALWEKDYLEESVVAFHKSIELNPDFEIAQNNLGVVYLDGYGDPKTSVEYFKNAININPNYTLAYFNLARAYQALGDKSHAAEYYQMTMDLNKITEELSEKDIRKRLYDLFE